MRSRLLEKHAIEPDPRYRICEKEAVIAASMFLGTAVVAMALVITLGLRQDLDWVWGLPSYLFWGVLCTQIGFLIALALILRFVYREIPLSPDGEVSDEPSNEPSNENAP